MLVRQLTARGDGVLAHGPLVLDLHSRQVRVGGRPLPLSRRRWSVLLILLSRAGETVPVIRFQKMLATDRPMSANAVQQVVSYLRRELATSGIDISTVPLRGYRLG